MEFVIPAVHAKQPSGKARLLCCTQGKEGFREQDVRTMLGMVAEAMRCKAECLEATEQQLQVALEENQGLKQLISVLTLRLEAEKAETAHLEEELQACFQAGEELKDEFLTFFQTQQSCRGDISDGGSQYFSSSNGSWDSSCDEETFQPQAYHAEQHRVLTSVGSVPSNTRPSPLCVSRSASAFTGLAAIGQPATNGLLSSQPSGRQSSVAHLEEPLVQRHDSKLRLQLASIKQRLQAITRLRADPELPELQASLGEDIMPVGEAASSASNVSTAQHCLLWSNDSYDPFL